MRFAVLTSLVFAALVAATDGNTCNGGDTYCCNSSPLLVNPVTGSFLAVPVSVLATLVCTPLTILGIPIGGTCSRTTVCCQDVDPTGLVNVQCIGLAL
ncbi:hypothetical protein AURDEDRAFT_166852 [Auricularia subglabra TFB-10046 SS5]|nr:hypothetical protein AURDEDRAFT_166852 [Auricularia subglabra TFB-10046 SS5]